MMKWILLSSIIWLWNETGGPVSWTPDNGVYRIYGTGTDYVEVSPGGVIGIPEQCHPATIATVYVSVHGDSLHVWREEFPLDTPAQSSTWGRVKARYPRGEPR